MPNIGPVMLDIETTELSVENKILIANPLVGGIILFSRNFESAKQIHALTNAIRAIKPSIIIAVDQEGGRVQRFTEGFSKLPAMGTLGELYQTKPNEAITYASNLAELMALEIQSVGCDISFAPVLDLGYRTSKVIGNRAFSTSIDEIIILGEAFIAGMTKAGMAATGKHFPGHGTVADDSHVTIPYDDRNFESIKNNDLKAFSDLSSKLSAIMPAHIIYPKVDTNPAGFSNIWLQEILRNELCFDGVIFSDDLTMKGAEAVGGYEQRAQLALKAGCDMVLVCNDNQAAREVLDALEKREHPEQSQKRLSKLLMKQPAIGLKELKKSSRWLYIAEQLKQFKMLSQG
jgi:beta-N-acetylhexosaminidase